MGTDEFPEIIRHFFRAVKIGMDLVLIIKSKIKPNFFLNFGKVKINKRQTVLIRKILQRVMFHVIGESGGTDQDQIQLLLFTKINDFIEIVQAVFVPGFKIGFF